MSQAFFSFIFEIEEGIEPSKPVKGAQELPLVWNRTISPTNHTTIYEEKPI